MSYLLTSGTRDERSLARMSVVTMFLVAFGVSADAFAVALGKGLTLPRVDIRAVLAVAVTFGAFQAAMPLLGWFLGASFAPYIEAVDHWIAFVLLGVIGAHMMWGALRGGDEAGFSDRLTLRSLLVLGVATSIDALVIGVGLAFMKVDVFVTVAIVGLVTFLISAAGMLVGQKIGNRWGTPAELLGGSILIGLGVLALWEHLAA
ncbi:manganese efflux pump MntP family protein [Dermatophilus congolensis]|uniref:manganese efflux pump MntP n=1 Tax=Dermatophilus congolensis TaxID=1863 RepID=UPI00312C80C1